MGKEQIITVFLTRNTYESQLDLATEARRCGFFLTIFLRIAIVCYCMGK